MLRRRDSFNDSNTSDEGRKLWGQSFLPVVLKNTTRFFVCRAAATMSGANLNAVENKCRTNPAEPSTLDAQIKSDVAPKDRSYKTCCVLLVFFGLRPCHAASATATSSLKLAYLCFRARATANMSTVWTAGLEMLSCISS